MDDRELLDRIRANQWHHNFEILPGVWTNGSYNPQTVFDMLDLPAAMSGLSVADIGASNGFYSFKVHERGAKVTAFDIRHENISGFALAKKAKGLEIPHYQVNVLELTPERWDKFDIVLFLGVIYHIPDPLKALRNVLGLAKKRVLIESYCIDNLPGVLADMPIVVYMPDPRRHPELAVNLDYSNFWGFTSTALRLMLEDLGCEVRRVISIGDRVLVDADYVGDPLAASRTAVAYGVFGTGDSELKVV